MRIGSSEEVKKIEIELSDQVEKKCLALKLKSIIQEDEDNL